MHTLGQPSSHVASATAGLTSGLHEQATRDRRVELESLLASELPRFQRLARRWLRNREDAEDAVQDAVLSAFRHIASFEGRARMSSWVMSIVINSVKMQLRKKQRKVLPLEHVLENGSLTVAEMLPDPGPDPEQSCQRSEVQGILARSIGQLSPTQGMALRVFELGGLPLKEAAERLRVPIGTLKAQVARGRGELRRKLQRVLGTRGSRACRLQSDPKP